LHNKGKSLTIKNFTKVKVIGGIGNQLFVLAFGLAISRRLKNKLIADDSLIHFGSNKSRKMEVAELVFNGFNIEFKSSKLSKLLNKKSNIMLNKIMWQFFKLNRRIVSEDKQLRPQFRFTKGQTFSGYFQDWFYVDYVYEQNSSFDFNLNNPSSIYLNLIKDAEQSKPIFVHVRLGDYLNFPNIYSILPENYFLDSLKHLGSNNNEKIWLFAEDLEQVRKFYPELIKRVNKVIDKKIGLNDIESFKLLCQGTKLVASNSTFSMWAAWFVNKNGFRAVVPLQMGVKGGSDSLSDERWDRYDVEKRVIILGVKSNARYLEKKREFLSKFE
jgi:hypothetical protein